MKSNTNLLSDICEAIVDCEHKTASIQEWGIPSVRTTDIKNGRIDFQNANKISEETYRLWTQRLEPKPGDIILAREAPVGEVGIIPPKVRACLGQRTVLIRTKSHVADPRYLLYLLITREMRHKMLSHSEGSTVAHLNMSVIRNLEIPKLPELSEQKAIAHILGTLDDKIELNRQMNQTLEAMARALFKSWFVDFDPVRAKAEGRQPAGLSPEIAALFPASFQDSELGKIPKGWEWGEISDLAKLGKGTVNPQDFPDKTFEHYSIPAFDEGQKPIVEKGIEIKSNKTLVQKDAILISKLNPRIPRLWIVPDKNVATPICSTEFLMILPQNEIDKAYLACLLNSEPFFEELCHLVTGTSGSHQRVQPPSLMKVKCIIASKEIRKAFQLISQPLHLQIESNRFQCHTLESIRNALLPMLLSGEIRLGQEIL